MQEALGRLRVAALRKKAMQCGVSPAGNKAEIVERLCKSAAARPPPGSDLRMVSLDMGVRNIGVCAMNSYGSQRPCLEKWYLARLDTDYSQPSFAHAAEKFVREHILTYDPKVVLMEKQRTRSSSSPQIPNAVLRTNIFEGMVHAILATQTSKLYIESIDPRLILARYDDTRDKSKRKTYAASKRVRTELVKKWIAEPATAPCSFASSFGKDTYIGKKDDLADSLVQGVTWNHWRHELASLTDV